MYRRVLTLVLIVSNVNYSTLMIHAVHRPLHEHSPLQLKVDSESFPTWFGLPTPSFTSTQYRVAYLRSWAAASGRSRAGRRGTVAPPPGDRTTPYVTPAAALPADRDVSPYQLGRAPPPVDEKDPTAAAGRVAAVPRRGWDVYRVRRGARVGGRRARGGLVDIPPAGGGVPPARAGSSPSASPLPRMEVAPATAEGSVMATPRTRHDASPAATTPPNRGPFPLLPVSSSRPLPPDENRRTEKDPAPTMAAELFALDPPPGESPLVGGRR